MWKSCETLIVNRYSGLCVKLPRTCGSALCRESATQGSCWADCVMRARLTSNAAILARCLHSHLSQHRHFAAASSSFCRGGLLFNSEQALNSCYPRFFPRLADSLSWALPWRGASTLAMASASQPELARQPPAVPPPEAPDGGKYKLAACQLAKVSDKEANIANARERIEAAADQGAQLIILPELWNCPISSDFFQLFAEDIDAGLEACPTLTMISEVARKKKVTIVGGSIPDRSGDKIYNTCCVFDKNGDMKAKFRKLHLFDVDIPGGITFKESDTITPGDGLCVVDTDVGRLAIGICYDIRFPEMAMLYAARGAHIICYPAAFNMTTGPLHWELLQKARAVDNQIFVVACSPARDTSASYVNWGHSTIVGPFGEILATTDHEEATIFADIDYSELDKRRLNMPLGSQRRGDLYRLTDVTRME